MTNKPDPMKIDGEAPPKGHKANARRVSSTQSESQQDELNRPTSKHELHAAVQEREDRVQGPPSAGDKEVQPEDQAQQVGNESHTWTAVKQDRNRRTRIRKMEKEQLGFLESEYMRLSVSNNSLRYQNSHLKDAIENVKRKHEDSKKPVAVGGLSAAFKDRAFPSQQQIIPNNMNQQLAVLLLGNENITREMAQTLPLMVGTYGSKPGLGDMSRSSVPFGSQQQNFCCNVYAVYCALDPAVKQVFLGDSHDPSCQNYRK